MGTQHGQGMIWLPSLIDQIGACHNRRLLERWRVQISSQAFPSWKYSMPWCTSRERLQYSQSTRECSYLSVAL